MLEIFKYTVQNVYKYIHIVGSQSLEMFSSWKTVPIKQQFPIFSFPQLLATALLLCDTNNRNHTYSVFLWLIYLT